MNRIVAMITMKGTMGLERNQRGRAKQSHLQWTILQVVTHIKTKMLCSVQAKQQKSLRVTEQEQ